MSTAFRITQGSINTTVLANLQDDLDRLQRLQERLSSGRQINRPSDSPAGTGSALQYRADIRRSEQYARNAQDGIGWLGTADQSLTSAVDLIRRAHDLVIQGANSSVGAAERQAIAREVDNLREGLIALANTRFQDRPIFAGTANVGQAYAPDGSYQGNVGNAAIIERNVAPGVAVPVNVDGPTVFGPDVSGLFASLAAISQHLDANDQNALIGDMGNLESSQQLMQDNLSKVGALYNRVQTMRDRADSTTQSLQSSLSDVENIDLPKTIVDLQLQQTAYQAALSASARIIQPSLVDFLR